MPKKKVSISTPTDPAQSVPPEWTCANCHDKLVAEAGDRCSRRCNTEWSRNNLEDFESNPFKYLRDRYICWEALLAYIVEPKSFRREHGFPLSRFIAAFKKTDYFSKPEPPNVAGRDQ